jgi:hypothetical protein
MRPQVEFIKLGPDLVEWNIGDKGVIVSYANDITGCPCALVVLYKDGSIVLAPYYTIKVTDPASL